MDLCYERVDNRIKAAIKSAVAEMGFYEDPAIEQEWSKDRAERYQVVIALLVAVQQAGEKLFEK